MPLSSDQAQLQLYLDCTANLYNQPSFIKDDPISIPHRFSALQDIEITAFWTAMLAWGQRKTIINNAVKLCQLMDDAPYDFILNHEEKDRERFLHFKHRTFQATDTLYFLEFFQQYYRQNHSLETAFASHLPAEYQHFIPAQGVPLPTEQHPMYAMLSGFHDAFFDHAFAPERTRKHVSTPKRNSACKRLNMFLRWMVRCDDQGVDFGLWRSISPALLVIPLDVHVDKVARRMGLLTRPHSDWRAAVELTEKLRAFNAEDPVWYDFALFGVSVNEGVSLAGSKP